MAQQSSITSDPTSDVDHRVVRFPTRSEATFPTNLPEQSVLAPAIGAQERVRTRTVRGVVVLEAACRLSEVVEELDRAIQLALAEGPRGVVCDLSLVGGAESDAIEVLATAGRHVRDWPGIPVAVACSDPQVREAVRAQPLGDHLIVSASLFSAVTDVLATPALTEERRQFAPHPTAARASREFVTHALLEWGLGSVSPFASLVASELVASSTINAGTNIELSVSRNLGALRLTVRDHGPGLPGQRPSVMYLHGRRLTVVAGLSRAFGVLPTADGGKVVWAVLEAARLSRSDSSDLSATERQESLILNHARGLTDLTLGPDSRASST
jgi:hypothetical protein